MTILSLVLAVYLHDFAHVPRAVLDDAAVELTRAYPELGISIDHDGPRADRDAIRIVILADATGGLRHAEASVMGAAVRTSGGGGVVYVFYHRVRAEAERYGASTGLVLACVIEHELGHLLLPGGAHSPNGLMQRIWRSEDFRAANQGQLRFSPDEMAMIRSRR